MLANDIINNLDKSKENEYSFLFSSFARHFGFNCHNLDSLENPYDSEDDEYEEYECFLDDLNSQIKRLKAYFVIGDAKKLINNNGQQLIAYFLDDKLIAESVVKLFRYEYREEVRALNEYSFEKLNEYLYETMMMYNLNQYCKVNPACLDVRSSYDVDRHFIKYYNFEISKDTIKLSSRDNMLYYNNLPITYNNQVAKVINSKTKEGDLTGKDYKLDIQLEDGTIIKDIHYLDLKIRYNLKK